MCVRVHGQREIQTLKVFKRLLPTDSQSHPSDSARSLCDSSKSSVNYGNPWKIAALFVLIWTEDSQIFRAEFPGVRLRETYDEILSNAIGERIPENHLFPPWSDRITEFQQPIPPDVYVKKHYSALRAYSGEPSATRRVMAEVKILEIISKNPRPNVNKYLGCIRNGDLIGGICLEKCVCALDDFMEGKVWARFMLIGKAPPFRRPDVLISGIKAAIDHIHLLTLDGIHLVHDDITPHNIMVDAAGNAILIDFDSCVTVGSPSRGGTPGWSKIPEVAAFENDAHGFELVTKFIRGEYYGEDINLGFGENADAIFPE